MQHKTNTHKKHEKMTNNEIRMAAQSIYRQIVHLTANVNNGCKEPTLEGLQKRFDKAIDWAINNGEFKALRQICHQMFSTFVGDLRAAADEVYEQNFECPYILGKEMRGEI